MLSYKTTCDAGMLVRGQVRSFIKDLAWKLDLKLDLDEDKGLIDSHFRVTVSGTDEAVKIFKHNFYEFFRLNE